MMKAGNMFSYMSAISRAIFAEAKASTGTDCYAMYFGQDVEGGYSTTNVSFMILASQPTVRIRKWPLSYLRAVYRSGRL